MKIELDLATFIYASIPLIATIFAGAWAILKYTIFRPLNNINDNLSGMKEILYKMDNRITILERDSEKLYCKRGIYEHETYRKRDTISSKARLKANG